MLMSKRDLYDRLCGLLVDARKAQGLTQVEVAERLNKPQSFVSKYESGERRVDVVELLEICKVLKIKPITVIGKLEVDNV